MKLTCLSEGGGCHYPASHVLDLGGYRILLECPLDLSALSVFSPVPIPSPNSAAVAAPLEGDECAFELIKSSPWYKTVSALHLWDPSLIDVIVVSCAAGLLGLPFLTRHPKFTSRTKIYVTEVAARLGRLMMEDLVSMHREFVMYYGPDNAMPEWMKWEELIKLPRELKKVIMGEDGEELVGWVPLYSAEDIKECMRKIQPVKLAENVCFNATLSLTAFNSGLEIGACNWSIRSPKRSISYLTSSILAPSYSEGFDFQSLCGNDVVLFSDFSSLHTIDGCDQSSILPVKGKEREALRDAKEDQDCALLHLCSSDEIVEETEKFHFVCTCIIDSLKSGGSVLIPTGRIEVILMLLEHLSNALPSADMDVPIFMISETAEEALAFAVSAPEWFSIERQENQIVGKTLLGHTDLLKENKLRVFPLLYSRETLEAWQEPCIVFSPHWSLRLGSTVHLLRHWHTDERCLLVLEQGVDAELALTPFMPVAMKVLQCSFLSGLRMEKVQSLLDILRPRLVLFPKSLQSPSTPRREDKLQAFMYYSEGTTVRTPNLSGDVEALLSSEQLSNLRPQKLQEKEMAIARLRGKLHVAGGKYIIVASKKSATSASKPRDAI